MTISEELREYILHYEMACGHKPSAMPITHLESLQLYLELKDFLVKDAPGCVPQVYGVDLYFTSEAKIMRDRIVKKAKK